MGKQKGLLGGYFRPTWGEGRVRGRLLDKGTAGGQVEASLCVCVGACTHRA